MRHTRAEVIKHTVREFQLLDRLVRDLKSKDWRRLLARAESKDPWTVKDALVHITYWKANTARVIRKQRRPADERGLEVNATNHLIYMRWRKRAPREVVAWHRQVQRDVLAALREAPTAWFSGREHAADWPGDLRGHSADHRVKDIERALKRRQG